MEKIIYLHPGLPKTGTSFLQRNLFVPHPEINNLGKKNSHLPDKGDLLKVFYKVMHYEKLSEDDYSNFLKIINSIDYKENFVNIIRNLSLNKLDNFTNHRFKESRDKNGNLSYLDKKSQIDEIKDCEVVNLKNSKNNLTKLKYLI